MDSSNAYKCYAKNDLNILIAVNLVCGTSKQCQRGKVCKDGDSLKATCGT